MATTGFIVSALNDFNNELAGELLVKSVIAGSTAEYVTVKEGIKYILKIFSKPSCLILILLICFYRQRLIKKWGNAF